MKTDAHKYFSDGTNSPKKSNPAFNVSFGSRPQASVDPRAPVTPIPRALLPFSIDQNVSPETLVETIRDPEDSQQLLFLQWQRGKVTVVPHLEQGRNIYVPPETKSCAVEELRLPDRILPCGDSLELLAELRSEISKFIDLSEDDLLLVSVFVLSSWFPDCLKAVPYLWLVGPLGSGKTTLLRLLHCLCRRALIIGDLRGASLYKSGLLHPTLLLDEFEPDNSRMGDEVLRLLRAGSTPGVPTARNGQLYSTFGHKVISSRQPPIDAALASRALLIRLLPTRKNVLPLDAAAMGRVAKAFQPKLLMFRLKSHSSVRKFRIPFGDMEDLTPRMADLANGMAAPLLGDAVSEAKLLTVLREHDRDARIERCLEPEWLAVEALFDLSHQGAATNRMISNMLVGGVSAYVNKTMASRGEDLRFSARGVGGILKGLGIPTRRLGNLGRGFSFTSVVKRKIHELARQFGFDRRDLATLSGLESGYGGTPCSLCESFGLTGGLRFVDLKRESRRHSLPSQRRPLFDETEMQETKK
jgi:hypothetical protein